jgi:hypothetical protein
MSPHRLTSITVGLPNVEKHFVDTPAAGVYQ